MYRLREKCRSNARYRDGRRSDPAAYIPAYRASHRAAYHRRARSGEVRSDLEHGAEKQLRHHRQRRAARSAQRYAGGVRSPRPDRRAQSLRLRSRYRRYRGRLYGLRQRFRDGLRRQPPPLLRRRGYLSARHGHDGLEFYRGKQRPALSLRYDRTQLGRAVQIRRRGLSRADLDDLRPLQPPHRAVQRVRGRQISVVRYRALRLSARLRP